MTEFTYTYSISLDFPSGLAPGQFSSEVSGSSLGSVFLRVDTSGDDCFVVFSASLSGPEVITLDGLVAAHVPQSTNIIFDALGYAQFMSELADSQALQLKANDVNGGVYIYAGNGGVEIETTNAFTVNAGAAIPITTTAGNITIDTPGLIELNAVSGINIGNDADAAPINIGTGTSVRTITMGNSTGATAVAITSGTGSVTLTSSNTGANSIQFNSAGGITSSVAGNINLTTSSANAAAITLDSSFGGGGIILSSGAEGVSINANNGLLGIGNSGGGDIQIGTAAITRTITMGNNTGATTLNLTSGTGGVAINSGGAFSANSSGSFAINTSNTFTVTSSGAFTANSGGTVAINSSGGTINVGTFADNFGVNIGTSGSRVVTIGNTNASSAVNIVSGSFGATFGNDASGGEIQIAASSNAKTIRIGNVTGGTRIFEKWGTGGHISHQSAPTALADSSATLLIGYLLGEIMTISPTADRNLTLPTAAAMVSGISSVSVDDCIDFRIMHLSTGVSDPVINVLMGVGGTSVGNTAIYPMVNNAGTYNYSGTGTFRMRFTNVGSGTEAYTIYRIA